MDLKQQVLAIDAPVRCLQAGQQRLNQLFFLGKGYLGLRRRTLKVFRHSHYNRLALHKFMTFWEMLSASRLR